MILLSSGCGQSIYACLHHRRRGWGEREREGGKEREGEGGREGRRERGREGGKERERGRERGKEREKGREREDEGISNTTQVIIFNTDLRSDMVESSDKGQPSSISRFIHHCHQQLQTITVLG